MTDHGWQVCDVPLKQLKLGMSPRAGEQDLDHVRSLAHCLDACPPILVERSTSTVIDGVHRVLAARMLGRTMVVARYFDGTHEEAFLEAIKSNITHGKPLTLSERESAAVKMLRMRSDWSDRLIADACGLSDKTIGRLRKSDEKIPQSSARIGRDGRHRPVDVAQLRASIASAIRERPEGSAEELARSLGTSPSTVRDVKKRLLRGEDPIASPPRRRSTFVDDAGTAEKSDQGRRVALTWRTNPVRSALRDGHQWSEWLDMSEIDSNHWEGRIAELPLSRIPQLIQMARDRAAQWVKFADSLEERCSGRKRSG
jgi:ParB-like chromosome segregation protein Spo0J